MFYSLRKKVKNIYRDHIRRPYVKNKILRKERQLFPSTEDREKYHCLQQNQCIDQQEIELFIKNAGPDPVFCRCNNDDHFVLHYTFFEQYHLPPVKLPKEAVILDLGSNIGLTVRHLKFLYPDSKIIGVELDQGNYLQALKNTAHLKNCFIINGAIWYEEGIVSYSGDIPQGLHVDNNETAGNNHVKAFTIQRLILEHHISTIHFMKMDIEGAESKIFEADIDWLDITQSLNIEVHHHESLDKYLTILKSKGFTCILSKKHWSSILAFK
ncbi:MAG: FkbM family methyltransferase [Bacteroidetes bacterium]|nr:FkbM family methyltransferase [Bacteroidota bacterium]